MAEALFNYPAEPPLQHSSSSPRPKTSRKSSRKRRRRHHRSSTEKQGNQVEKDNQEHEEEEEEQQQRQEERPPLPSINKDKNPKSPRSMNQTENKEITKTSSNINNYQEEDDNQFEEEEVDEILYWTENSMKDPSILEKCNPDLLPTIIINLKDLRDQYLVDNEVDDSCAADMALTEARKIHKKNLMKIATKSLRQELEARLQEAEDALHDLEDTCQYQEDRMNREMEKETSDLMNKHKEEMERLIATWTSQPPPPTAEQLEIELGKTYSVRPQTSRKKNRDTIENFDDILTRKSQTNDKIESKSVSEKSTQDDKFNEDNDNDQLYNDDTVRKFRQYNKLSPQLRYLYDQADRYLRAKRYQESKAVEKKAKELQKIETERNHIRMEQDYNAALEALQIKQADEIAIQEKAHNDRRNEYYHARDFDMNVAKNRIEKIKKELAAAENPDKVWALHHRHDLDNQSSTQTQKSIYSTNGVFETTGSTSAVGKETIYSKFNRINLPPLKSGRSSRRIIKNTERSFKFNQGYVFT